MRYVKRARTVRATPGRPYNRAACPPTLGLDRSPLDVTHRDFGNVVVAAPVGRADLAGSAALETALSPLWERADVEGIVLDLSGVPYISSVGLRVLMIAAKQMRGRRARIAVACLQPVVAEIFAISRFDKVLEVFPGVRDALAAMSAPALAAYDAN
jgi:anti-anti-sigma factor